MTHLLNWKEKYAGKKRPRRMLALDGGGICGVIALEILAELERQLRTATGQGDKFRLGDHFDYIAGTSTGAIIATGLAIGMSANELLDFYEKSGPDMFDRVGILQRLRNEFDDGNMRRLLQDILGQRTLGAPDLKCLLMLVTRNATTDSAWPVSNNPDAKYNHTKRPDCNLQIPLWQLVRASGAAPTYFPPEVLQWDPKDRRKTFTFVDGGTTSYNNPAFLLYRMATLPQYKLNWTSGEDDLAVVSVGCGAAARSEDVVRDYGRLIHREAAALISVLIGAANVDQDINCRSIGRCVFGSPIDRELGDMIPLDENGTAIPLERKLGRAFLYARYDPDVTRAGLDDLGLSKVDSASVQKIDQTEFIKPMRDVGEAFAKKYVKIESFGGLLHGTA